MTEKSLVGRPVLRVEDERLLTVGGTFMNDVPMPGARHLVFVRSTVAHAKLLDVDTAEAARAPGVLRVFTGAEVDVEPLPPEIGPVNQAMTQPLMARDVVRFVGEPVAAVVADSVAQAQRAATLVRVRYEPLPPVVDPADAVTDQVLLHPDAGTNTALKLTFAKPAGRGDILADCEVVVRRHIVNQRVAASPLETRAAIAVWQTHDDLTLYAGSQAPHLWRDQVAKALGLAVDGVRIIVPDMGGAFGSKAFAGREDILLAWAARQLELPLRWSETRAENLMVGSHGRAQVQEVELGGTRDGRIQAYRLSVLQDTGAYPRISAILPFWTRTMVTGPYVVPKAKFTANSVATTTAPVGSYRGAGQPEATAALERIMDCYAAEIGMDPIEVRRRNLIPADKFPWTTLTRATYDTGNYQAALDRLMSEMDYPELRARQRELRADGAVEQLGIGVSVFVEMTGADTRSDVATVSISADGDVVVRVGTCGHGQGHATSWAMLAATELGVPLARIDMVQGDTGRVPEGGGGTGGSRSLQTGGLAVRAAAIALIEQEATRAATLLGGPVTFDPALAAFTGNDGRQCGWAELARDAGGIVECCATYQPTAATTSFGAHGAVVGVDVETGRVRVHRIVAVDDAGTILNPLIAEGQVHGGLAQGVGQALTELIGYTPDGQPVHRDLVDYAFIAAPELPSFDTVLMQTPTPVNPLGVKGIGESGAVGVPPAVQNAVVDAVSHLGVRHIDMPLTPERVWRAIQDSLDGRGSVCGSISDQP